MNQINYALLVFAGAPLNGMEHSNVRAGIVDFYSSHRLNNRIGRVYFHGI